MTRRPILLEACLDSVASAIAAQAGGAGRLELCANLAEGGTTPSAGMIEACRARVMIPLFVMIRPRAGDFLYSDAECEVMQRDIVGAKALHADGVVLGLLRSDGAVDIEHTRDLVEVARPLAVTFHRAFDVCRDALEALEDLRAIGVDRILTSGQAPTALEGAPLIAELVQRARGKIAILPGGGITQENVEEIVKRTGASEVHVRGTRPMQSNMRHQNPRVSFRGKTALTDDVLEVTDESRIRAMVERLNR
jgi:copper homeostasis protein